MNFLVRLPPEATPASAQRHQFDYPQQADVLTKQLCEVLILRWPFPTVYICIKGQSIEAMSLVTR